MNNIMLVFIFAVFGLACATTQSENVEPTTSQDSTQKPTPTPASMMNAILPKSEPTPMRTPTGIQTPINDADYTVTKLDQNKMKQTTLNRQPQEIIEAVFQNESSDRDNRRMPEKIKIKVLERDLNRDGVPERIVLSRLYSDEGVPSLCIFRFENEKWNQCIFMTEGSPDDDLSEIEFLSKPDKGEFDLIRLTDAYGDKEVIKDIFYYQMQNGKYELIECRKIEGKTEKVISCPQ